MTSEFATSLRGGEKPHGATSPCQPEEHGPRNSHLAAGASVPGEGRKMDLERITQLRENLSYARGRATVGEIIDLLIDAVDFMLTDMQLEQQGQQRKLGSPYDLGHVRRK